MTILVTDEVLREAFKRGERVALARVYREYARDLFAFLSRGFAIRTAGGSHYFSGYSEPWRLETAVQDVFSKAFSSNARMAYDGMRPFKNYLFTIAKNHVIDLFRRKPREFLPIDELPEDAANDSLGHLGTKQKCPEEATQESQMKAHVEEYLGTLDNDRRGIFEVRFLEGRSIEDSAIKLSVTEYQIKKEEKRIKKNFFNWMTSRGYFKGYSFSELGVQRCIAFLLIMYGTVGQC